MVAPKQWRISLDMARGEFVTSHVADDIVPDPIALGNAGQTHEHIQFGSGTFEPILSAQWASRRFVAMTEARLSVYENRNGFRAPSTLIWSAGPTFRVGRISIGPRINGQVQTLARWSGVIDEVALRFQRIKSGNSLITENRHLDRQEPATLGN
jgi:hypothetical protein